MKMNISKYRKISYKDMDLFSAYTGLNHSYFTKKLKYVILEQY